MFCFFSFSDKRSPSPAEDGQFSSVVAIVPPCSHCPSFKLKQKKKKIIIRPRVIINGNSNLNGSNRKWGEEGGGKCQPSEKFRNLIFRMISTVEMADEAVDPNPRVYITFKCSIVRRFGRNSFDRTPRPLNYEIQFKKLTSYFILFNRPFLRFR